MKLLVLGGTIFLGRHVVAAALARGHAVTLFHRGRHGGVLLSDLTRAHAAGLRTRDVRATIADTLAWTPDADDRAVARPVATLAAAREAECLATLRR
jgi:2'-hydroxyisoflavone reductase